MERGEREMDEWVVYGRSMATNAVEEEGFDKIELRCRCWQIAKVIAERAEGCAPEIFKRSFSIGKELRAVGKEGKGSTGLEGDPDEFG